MPVLNYVKEHRTILNINQAELGKLVDVSRQTISLIERGDYSPSITLSLKLAKIFQIKVDDLFILTEEETKNENKK
jgi:Predicted transcriptional regulators